MATRTNRKPVKKTVKTLPARASVTVDAEPEEEILMSSGGADAEDVDFEDLGELEDMERIRAMLDTAPPNGSINVYLVPSKGALEYLTEISPGDFSVEWLKQNYGGGTYRLRGYTTGLEKRLWINREIKIHETVAEKTQRERAAVLPQSAPGADMGAIMQTMMMGFKEMGASIIAAIPKQDSKAEVIEMLGALKALNPEPKPVPASDPLKMLETVQRMIDMSRNIRGGEDDDPLSTALKTFAPMLGAAFQQAQTPQHQRGMMHAAQFPQQQPHGEQDMNMIIRAAIASMLKRLLKAAEKNSDPLAYAVIVLDDVEDKPEEVQNQFFAFVTGENCLEQIFQIAPPAKQYEQWFSELRAAILEQIAPEPVAENVVQFQQGAGFSQSVNGAGAGAGLTDAGGDGISALHDGPKS